MEMTALVIAEHDNTSIRSATLNTVTAAGACGGDVHMRVAAENATAAAEAAAQIAGVVRVIHADGASVKDGLAENPQRKSWPSPATTAISRFRPRPVARTPRRAWR